MPELPEVETVRRHLERTMLGLEITDVACRSPSMRRPLDPGRLRSGLAGKAFVGARRRGKYLLLDVDDGSVLMHLGMSGILGIAPSGSPFADHTHLVIRFEDGRELRFTDPRRFGFAHFLAGGEEEDDPSLRRLGIEPLSKQLPTELPRLYRARRAPVKNLMLDQGLVAGIGNIYAAEALWRAGIHPRRRGSAIALPRLVRLAQAIQSVLREAIEQGGTTLRDFAAPDGSPGYFTVKLDVYGSAGRSCPRCSETLRSATISGRATVYCARCQR
jgi:formamidopyrimidine-DNA glycosylase